jgi:calcium/calmodulin-dependent protein kinase I
LANRIESLKMKDEDNEDENDDGVPGDAAEAAGEALAARNYNKGIGSAISPIAGSGKKSLSKIARGAIFREVVLAKVRELKEEEARKKFEEAAAASKTEPGK